MNKQQIIRAYVEFQRQYSLAPTDFVMGAGAACVMHGLRHETEDLDMDLVAGLYDELVASGRFPAVMFNGQKVGITWSNAIDLHPLKDSETVMIHGVCCYSLERLLQQKRLLNRPKDQADIAALERLIASTPTKKESPLKNYIERHLIAHQTGGEDWPAGASFAVKYNLSAWPTGWCKEASVTFFESLQDLAVWQAAKVEWARSEDNYFAAEVFEWDLGPKARPDLSTDVANVGFTSKEQVQRQATLIHEERPREKAKAPPVPTNATFVRLLVQAKRVHFDARWVDASADLGGAVYGPFAPRLDVGEMRATLDPAGRNVLILGLGYRCNLVLRQRSTRDPILGIVFADAPAPFVAAVLNASERHIDGVISEAHMQVICDVIVKDLARTRTDWEDLARVLSPWSVV